MPTGTMTISGQVTATQDGAIKVKSASGEAILMQINGDTQVFVNGRPGGISDLTEGTEVRAAFQPPSETTLPRALRVDVTGSAK
jgi:hypothetical protein